MNTNKDVRESEKAQTLIQAELSHCYLNAYSLIEDEDEYGNADYVEGLAVDQDGLVIPHGWVEKDGVIIDPTLPTDELAYFPGLRFSGREGLEEALEIPEPEDTSEWLPIYKRFGLHGIDSPDYRAAIVAAYQHAGQEDMIPCFLGHRSPNP